MKHHYYYSALIAVFVATLAPFSFAQTQQQDNTNVWAKAEAKIEAHLKDIDPKIRYAEFKSERLSKYLPEFRVFVGFERNTIGQSSLFIVSKDAKITDLDNNDWGGIAKFLRARSIQVKTQEEASEFARFVVELQGAKSYVSLLHINTKNFTVFDKRFIEFYYGPRADSDWKYSSEKREGGWKVTVKYVGDTSVSIIMPPTYEMDIDEQGNFRDLRRNP